MITTIQFNKKNKEKPSSLSGVRNRRCLYHAVTAMLKTKEHPITLFYYRLKRRKGDKCGNLPRVAAMRKLATLIFLLVTRGEDYRGPSSSSKRWKGVSGQIMPENHVEKLCCLLENMAFDFQGTLHDFYQWIKQGTMST